MEIDLIIRNSKYYVILTT